MDKKIQKEVYERVLTLFKWPVSIWNLMIYCLSFYVQNDFSSEKLTILQSLLFFLALLIQILINFQSQKLIEFNKFFFLASQVVLIILAGILIQPGEIILYMGLLPMVGVQIVTLYEISWIFLISIILPIQVIVITLQWINTGFFLAFMTLEAQIFLNIIVYFGWQFYQKQLNEMVRTEHLLSELQLAYTQVKQISQQNERNRIARDLHDTLMQGLAGVTMQLEGANILLEKSDIQRAKGVLKKTIILSRETLKESRSTVYKMKQKGTKSFNLKERLESLGKVFYENYGLSVKLRVDDVELPSDIYENISRIIAEALTNIVKHAQTDFAIIKISMNQKLIIEIIDFGVGFNVQRGKKKTKHFGIDTMTERVAELDGSVDIKSHAGEGTTIKIIIPVALRWQNV